MANNVIKVGAADDGLSIKQGPFAIGAAGLGDYGPTSRTNYYASAEIPQGGYAFYHVDDSGNIRANVAHDDNQAMYFLKSYGATGTTLNQMLSWASASGTVIGLDADITTTEIVTANSGSAGTSGSSGSGGGSSQFPKAWIVKTYYHLYAAMSDSNGIQGMVYTAESSMTDNVRLWSDPELTVPFVPDVYPNYSYIRFSSTNQVFNFSTDYDRGGVKTYYMWDPNTNWQFSLYISETDIGRVCAKNESNISAYVAGNAPLQVGTQIYLNSAATTPYYQNDSRTFYAGLAIPGSPLFEFSKITGQLTAIIPGSTC